MKLIKTIFFIFLFGINKIFAQTIYPQLINAAGGLSNLNGGTVSWSVGESIVFTNPANIIIVTQGFQQPKSNKCPNVFLTSIGDTICAGENAEIKILSSEQSISYQAIYGGVAVGTAVIGNGQTITLEIPASVFNTNNLNYTFKVSASKIACPLVELDLKVNVLIRSNINSNLKIKNDTMCVVRDGNIAINSTQLGVTYQLFKNIFNYLKEEITNSLLIIKY